MSQYKVKGHWRKTPSGLVWIAAHNKPTRLGRLRLWRPKNWILFNPKEPTDE